MSWTAPRTWVAGEVVTAALLNAHIRDNELILATVPTVSDFSSFGTTSFSKTSDMKWHIVECWGGGASGSSAGGGVQTGPAMGAGGGGAGYCKKLYASSSLSASESLTVGQGGSGNSGNGNAGLNTTFKSMTAGGGANGNAMSFTNGSTLANEGRGGTASGGDENLTGDDGGKGQVITATVVWLNHGGGSPRGGGTATFAAASAGVGTAGKFPGGAASGSFAASPTGQNGASGANGRVLITSYFS